MSLSPLSWALFCLSLWIVGFPYYLVRRSERRPIAAPGQPPSVPLG